MERMEISWKCVLYFYSYRTKHHCIFRATDRIVQGPHSIPLFNILYSNTDYVSMHIVNFIFMWHELQKSSPCLGSTFLVSVLESLKIWISFPFTDVFRKYIILFSFFESTVLLYTAYLFWSKLRKLICTA